MSKLVVTKKSTHHEFTIRCRDCSELHLHDWGKPTAPEWGKALNHADQTGHRIMTSVSKVTRKEMLSNLVGVNSD